MSLRELGWPAGVAMIATLLTALVLAIDYTGFGVWMSWPVQLAGIAALALALRRNRHWWPLAFLPILLFPLGLWVLLIYEISQGRFP